MIKWGKGNRKEGAGSKELNGTAGGMSESRSWWLRRHRHGRQPCPRNAHGPLPRETPRPMIQASRSNMARTVAALAAPPNCIGTWGTTLTPPLSPHHRRQRTTWFSPSQSHSYPAHNWRGEREREPNSTTLPTGSRGCGATYPVKISLKVFSSSKSLPPSTRTMMAQLPPSAGRTSGKL